MRIRNKSGQIEGNPISIGVSTVFEISHDRDDSETEIRTRRDQNKTRPKRDETKIRQDWDDTKMSTRQYLDNTKTKTKTKAGLRRYQDDTYPDEGFLRF
jgi:hypothetical protein